MTYDQAYLDDIKQRRADAQSQLDALAGECPEEAADLVEEIAAYSRILAREV